MIMAAFFKPLNYFVFIVNKMYYVRKCHGLKIHVKKIINETCCYVDVFVLKISKYISIYRDLHLHFFPLKQEP